MGKPTPAQELRTAAEKLRDACAVVLPSPWALQVSDGGSCISIISNHPDGKAKNGRRAVIARTNPPSMATATYLALMQPAVATALATWLESWDSIDVDETHSAPDDWFHALQIARAINGNAS